MSEKKIGFTACINAIGQDFYKENKDRCVFASGSDAHKGLWCFVGVNTTDFHYDGLHLSAGFDEWEYYASCYVNNMVVTMDRCRLPKGQ